MSQPYRVEPTNDGRWMVANAVPGPVLCVSDDKQWCEVQADLFNAAYAAGHEAGRRAEAKDIAAALDMTAREEAP